MTVVGGNAQFAGRGVGQVVDFLDALSQLVEGGQAVLQQCGTIDRRFGTMTITVQERPPQLSLKVGNDLRYDRLGDGEMPRGLGHAALLRYRL